MSTNSIRLCPTKTLIHSIQGHVCGVCCVCCCVVCVCVLCVLLCVCRKLRLNMSTNSIRLCPTKTLILSIQGHVCGAFSVCVVVLCCVFCVCVLLCCSCISRTKNVNYSREFIKAYLRQNAVHAPQGHWVVSVCKCMCDCSLNWQDELVHKHALKLVEPGSRFHTHSH
jgi:hypothetical protein